jgi:hypothetical protein
MENLKKELEERFNCQLHEGYSSRADDNPDEEDGHFISYNIEPAFEQSAFEDYPPILNLYENGKLQFFHDASPYPVKVNTHEEKRSMQQALCPYPVQESKVTREDYCVFIITLLEQS